MSTELDNMRGNWGFPTSVRFGVGRIVELPEACRELGIERPLVVTDKGLASLPMLADAVSMLVDAGLGAALFSDVQGNPVEANVDAGLQVYRDGGHDGIVAFGGGSAMDVGKCIALMVGQSRPIWDFEDREDWYTRADADAIAPVIAVPTTSGTGSEVGRAGVITNLEDHTKRIIFHPKMLPAIVIEDREALFHPMADGVAVEGMRLIKNWLPAACADGNDLEARGNMQVASSMGATAFQKGLGAMHSLSHPCGSLLDTHHGLTNGVVMPYVLAFNGEVIEEKMTALARYLDLPNPSGKSVRDWVLHLREEIGIAHTLAGIGVSEELIPRLAKMAVDDPTAPTNPVKLTVANLETLYANAINGALAS
jgi:alcohol dehydrogenase class IV